MKVFAPNYYKKFSCIADKCKHSCCIGWEIDIDDTTFEQYKNINNDFGRKINDNIVINNDCAYFKLTDNERCPFLNKNNLCEIILNLGENALCQICSDHPRFKNFYGDRVEIGLGLTCEEVARIIINETTSFKLIEIDDDNEVSYVYEDELNFFDLRNGIFKIIESNSNFKVTVTKILEKFKIIFPQKTITEWADIYLSLERLDEKWEEILNKLKLTNNIQFPLTHNNENALKNLLIYFIYRHLGDSVYDGNFKGRLLFSILSCYFISALSTFDLTLEEIARMYSSEIEYSEENLNNLIDLLQNESLEI